MAELKPGGINLTEYLMSKSDLTVTTRKIDTNSSIMEIKGEINAFAENALLITLLVRCNRQKQSLVAYNLAEHYQKIFELTRLNEAVIIFPTEGEALKSFEMATSGMNVLD
jgi:hypothetical protein